MQKRKKLTVRKTFECQAEIWEAVARLLEADPITFPTFTHLNHMALMMLLSENAHKINDGYKMEGKAIII